MTKLYVAPKAFVEHEGKVLVLRESKRYLDATQVGKYDVPGGRMESSEQVEEALIREVQEETGLAVYIEKVFAVHEWNPVIRGEQAHVVGIFFICNAGSKDVRLSDDHDDYKWIDPDLYETEDVIENLDKPFQTYLALRK